MRPKTGIAIAALVVPAIFLVRSITRLAQVEQDHAKVEAVFQQRLEESKARQASAEGPGATLDTPGCVEWAMAKCAPAADGACDACTDVLRGCLSTSRLSEAYCATVPGYTAKDSEQSDGWRKLQRDTHHLSHWSCAAMFKFVQLHCHPL